VEHVERNWPWRPIIGHSVSPQAVGFATTVRHALHTDRLSSVVSLATVFLAPLPTRARVRSAQFMHKEPSPRACRPAGFASTPLRLRRRFGRSGWRTTDLADRHSIMSIGARAPLHRSSTGHRSAARKPRAARRALGQPLPARANRWRDVLVEPEQVGGVVAVLHRHEPGVGRGRLRPRPAACVTSADELGPAWLAG